MTEEITSRKDPVNIAGKEFFRRLFDDAPLANILVDKNGLIYAWNKRAELVLRKVREPYQGIKLAGYVRQADHDLLRNAVNQSCSSPHGDERDLQIQTKNGDIWLVMIININFTDSEECLLYMTLFDISGGKDENGLCDLVSWHDPLTGLPNRKLMFDRLQYSLNDAGRRREKLALLFIDCDNFKNINDSYGHDVGDLVLSHLATSMKQCLRDNDTLARMGGDEFMVLMHHVENINVVLPVARRLLRAVTVPVEIRGNTIKISASIGISIAPDDGEIPEVLVRNADLAMYQAKGNGRGGYVLFNESLSQAAEQREKLARQLQQAIENRELDIHYQPLLSINGRRIIAVEALLRWRGGSDGWQTAGQFLPLAESLNLGIPFYDWAIEQACHQMGLWLKQGLLTEGSRFRMAINLDCCQLGKHDFIEKLRDVMRRYGVRGSDLAFEIKEADIRSADTTIDRNLKALAALGCEIHLDDFSQGFYSLYRLTDISFSWLKVDQAVTDMLLDNDIGRTLLTTIIDVAHDLGIKVLAEGIESEASLRWLEQNKCDGIQGFYYCQPMSAAQIELLLGLRNRLL